MVEKVQVVPSVVRCVTADVTRYQMLCKGTCYFRLYQIQYRQGDQWEILHIHNKGYTQWVFTFFLMLQYNLINNSVNFMYINFTL